MKFIKNMSVTIKILLMVLIPMAGLLYFSISSVADSYQTAGAIQNIQVGIRASAMAGDLVEYGYETKGERAGALIFLSGYGMRNDGYLWGAVPAAMKGLNLKQIKPLADRAGCAGSRPWIRDRISPNRNIR